ncbi:MAG: UvrD-helicase domain-containing protein, partial [Ignavibacteria bacterium]
MKNFLIYKSSAGSGKTYTLVKEYLKLVLQNPDDFRHILAITFTNKTAEEMKTRIINNLVGLSKGSESNLESELRKEGLKGDVKIKAKKVLQNILHKYFYFSVMTIDSFFHKVIRAFAKELKLQFGFNVELEEDAVMNKVVDTVLDEAGTNKELTEYLEELTFYSMDDNKGWWIDAKIKNLGKEIYKERFWQKRIKDILKDKKKIRKVISKLFQILKEYESKMESFGREAEKIMVDFGNIPEDYPNKSKSFMVWLVNKPSTKPNTFVSEANRSIKNCWNRNSKSSVRQSIENGIYEILKEAYEFYQENKKPYFSAKELLKTIYMLGIFGDLIEKLRDWRDENRALLISDTNTILTEVISGETSPFIYERIGNTYKNFLMDEFQDTSTFQWNNMLPLLINALSEGSFSMVVGDVKQSIYRFRNGNMMLMLMQIKDDLKQYKDLIEEKELLENFRSKIEIVNFNNKFFTKIRELALPDIPFEMQELMMKSYEQVEQSTDRCRDGGYVKVQFAEKDEGRKMSASEIAGEILIETVSEVLRDGYRQQDIFILVRKKTDGTEAARLLIEKGYNVVSSESLLLTNSPKVKLIINLLKYITDNKNQLARTEVLYNYQLLNNSLENLDKIFRDKENALFAKTFPAGFLKNGGINPRLYRLNLYELVENLIIIFGLNDKADAYLLRFLDVIDEYTQKNSADIAGFFDWWDENFGNYSIVVPAGEDAVNIMTIHKAKGLESPVVIVPYANWKTDAMDFIWTSSEKAPFNELPG